MTNALLIFAQNPKARNLQTFEEWNANGFHILSGEKGITLLFYHYKVRIAEPYTKAFFSDRQVRQENFSSTMPNSSKLHDVPSLTCLLEFLKTAFEMKVQYGSIQDKTLFMMDYENRTITIPAMISDETCLIRLIQSVSRLEIQDKLKKRELEKHQFDFCQILFSFYLANLFRLHNRVFQDQLLEITENLTLDEFVRCLFRTYCSLQSVHFAWQEFLKNAIPESCETDKIQLNQYRTLKEKIFAARQKNGV